MSRHETDARPAGPDGRIRTIGYLTSTVAQTVGQTRWHGVMDAARAHGARLICLAGSYWRESMGEAAANVLYDLVDPEMVDGLILGNVVREDLVGKDESLDFYQRYAGLPAVSLRELPIDIPYVGLDNTQGMRDAIAHLVQVHGARRIAFLRGPGGHWTAEARYRIYRDLLIEYGLTVDPELITPPLDWTVSGVEVLLDERGLRPGRDLQAILSSSHRKTRQALHVLEERGYMVPGDLAIVDCNDDLEGEAHTPPVTSVAQAYYEQGWRATETLLAMLAGEPVPHQVFLPSRLVVRQSCGCLSLAVRQAAAPDADVGDLPLSAPERPAAIAARLTDLARDTHLGAGQASRLVESFLADVSGAAPGGFLPVLNDCLRLDVTRELKIADWQQILSALRGWLRPGLAGMNALARAEDLWQQARVLVSETAERVQVRRALSAEQQGNVLRRIGQALISSFGLGHLAEVLARDLPALGISRCYLSLYEDPAQPAGWSRLILAFDERGRLDLDPEACRFLSRRLVPDGLLAAGVIHSLVVEPLYFETYHLGLVLFDAGTRDGVVYGALSGQIASALRGAMLLQEREQNERVLERRALQLQTAGQVSQAASSILDPRTLVQSAVELIQERFGLYYVGLFLLNDVEGAGAGRGDWVVLRAGTGHAGQEMLMRQHKLRLGGHSMVGQCVATGQPRIAENVGEERHHAANALLPDTRSELALPLISRGRPIGALTIQSSEPAAFGAEDVALFQTMANQLANSIENAYLLQQTQSAMEELKAVQRRYIRQAWNTYLDPDTKKNE